MNALDINATQVRCLACPRPIDLPERHVTLARHVETETGGRVDVYAATVVAYLHLPCAEGLDTLTAMRRQLDRQAGAA